MPKPEIPKTDIKDLPDGTFIKIGNEPYLIASGELYHWTPFGYKKVNDLILPEQVSILTPSTIINAFKSGYKPQISV